LCCAQRVSKRTVTHNRSADEKQKNFTQRTSKLHFQLLLRQGGQPDQAVEAVAQLRHHAFLDLRDEIRLGSLVEPARELLLAGLFVLCLLIK
jgi:hypothetical protein